MQPTHVVVSLPVRDTRASFAFYRDGLGFQVERMNDDVLSLDLPGLSLFLVSRRQFEKSSKMADARAFFPDSASGCLLSCAIATKAEVGATLRRVEAAGGSIFEPTTRNLFGREQYVACFKDPDGHLWELVWNVDEAAM